MPFYEIAKSPLYIDGIIREVRERVELSAEAAAAFDPEDVVAVDALEVEESQEQEEEKQVSEVAGEGAPAGEDEYNEELPAGEGAGEKAATE